MQTEVQLLSRKLKKTLTECDIDIMYSFTAKSRCLLLLLHMAHSKAPTRYDIGSHTQLQIHRTAFSNMCKACIRATETFLHE